MEKAFELVFGCVWEATPEVRTHDFDAELVHFDCKSELLGCVHGCILPVEGWLEVQWRLAGGQPLHACRGWFWRGRGSGGGGRCVWAWSELTEGPDRWFPAELADLGLGADVDIALSGVDGQGHGVIHPVAVGHSFRDEAGERDERAGVIVIGWVGGSVVHGAGVGDEEAEQVLEGGGTARREEAEELEADDLGDEGLDAGAVMEVEVKEAGLDVDCAVGAAAPGCFAVGFLADWVMEEAVVGRVCGVGAARKAGSADGASALFRRPSQGGEVALSSQRRFGGGGYYRTTWGFREGCFKPPDETLHGGVGRTGDVLKRFGVGWKFRCHGARVWPAEAEREWAVVMRPGARGQG